MFVVYLELLVVTLRDLRDPTCAIRLAKLPVCMYNPAASSVVGSDHDKGFI